MTTALDRRIVHLEVNDSGGWRRITSFEVEAWEEGDLEIHAEQLLEMSTHPKIKARIIIPGDSAPLVTWTREDGWREWVHPADRVAA